MILRILLVTLGLSVAGAIVGTAVGWAVLVSWGLFDGVIAVTDPFVVEFAFIVAGRMGAVLGPVAAWLLMRHVPIGRAIGGTALGTFAGGIAGIALVIDPVLSGMAGFAAAAVWLRAATPRHSRARLAPGSSSD
ncbi:MAG TPA: hypothetical protein VFQ45_18660 [Longimicrobium sp.]|nr:hypothetical protein [Longimicrobium sp.]